MDTLKKLKSAGLVQSMDTLKKLKSAGLVQSMDALRKLKPTIANSINGCIKVNLMFWLILIPSS